MKTHQRNQESTEISQTADFAVVGATVIDIFTGAKAVQDIVVKDEKIIQLVPHGSLNLPEDMQVICAKGKYVIPGLCDMHVHLTIWPEFTDRISTLMVANGITSVRDMGGKLDDILAFRTKARQQNTVAPRLWIAGPIIDGSPRIMEKSDEYGLADISVCVDTPEEANNMVDALINCDVDFIKAYEMLQPEVFSALLHRAQTHQLPAAGHLPIRMTIPEVLDVGPYDIQHLGGVCSGMRFECSSNPQRLLFDKVSILDAHSPPESGLSLAMRVLKEVPAKASEQDSNLRANLIQKFVEKDTWHTPTLVNRVGSHTLGFTEDPHWLSAFRYLPKERQVRSKIARDRGEGDIETIAWNHWTLETVGLMHEAGVRFLAGTDCPPTLHYTPGFALHFELKAMVLAGLSPLEALQTATINPAEFFSITDQLGSIEVGKFADMVFLDADPLKDIDNTLSIVAIVSRGKYFDRQALDEMLASVIEI